MTYLDAYRIAASVVGFSKQDRLVTGPPPNKQTNNHASKEWDDGCNKRFRIATGGERAV